MMNRYPQKSDGHGSLKDIQVLVNDYPGLLFRKIQSEIAIKSTDIKWCSPIRDENFAEYRDEGFLQQLGLEKHEKSLFDFWPKKGPQWDGLGKGDCGEYFLVEAKANIPEMISPESKASGASLQKIKKSLDACKEHLHVKNGCDWAGTFYQYANRLAHLYFLREIINVPAYLVFVYFTGDKSVSGPDTIAEWKTAITVMEGALGLGRHRLEKFIAKVYVDVKEIGLERATDK